MLIDFENTGYIKICPQPMVEEQCTYIPASTWGFIRGDISEQSDLITLLNNIESGLTPEQIKLLSGVDSRFEDVENSVIELDAKNTNEYVEINLMLDTKADAADVYTKSEIDNKGYLTEHQSLAGYATENWVYNQGYISVETDPVWLSEKHKYALKTDLPSVAGLASESWVNEQLTLKANADNVYTKSEIDNKGYLTEHQSLAGYATETYVDNAIGNIEIIADLTGYATENWVKEQNYLTEHQSLDNYYTKSEVDSAISNVEVDLTGYATEQWVNDKGYLTEHQSLAGYATEQWVNDQNYLTEHQSLTDYYTKSEVNSAVESKVDISNIWTGTEDEWEALSTEQQNSYIIAMIEL